MKWNDADALDFVSWQEARSEEPEHMYLYVMLGVHASHRFAVPFGRPIPFHPWGIVRIRASQQRRHGAKDGVAVSLT